MPRALITGFTGQDGTFLTRHLLDMGYEVIGLVRRVSTEPPHRTRGHFDFSKEFATNQLRLEIGDLCDMKSLLRIFSTYPIDEVYNLAAQSDVRLSFDLPEETYRANAFGVLNLINVMDLLVPKAKLYQASTSELYGHTGGRQDEKTPFAPASPYGEAKLAAYWAVANYRKRGRFACNGILFNHESEIRGGNFVTQKIVRAFVHLKVYGLGLLELGNLEAHRDWGYAGDYVEAMHRMLSAAQPDDYVVATGTTRSVREFVETVADLLKMDLHWAETLDATRGAGFVNGERFIRIDPAFYRPVEVDHLHGDASKARAVLGWKPETSFEAMIDKMIQAELVRVAP